MPSLKAWAVLTIIRENPSFASEIGERYVERFGELLGPRRQLHDGVLPSLRAEGFIESYYPRRGPGRAHYRLTASGATAWRGWLRGPFTDDKDEDEVALEVAVRLVATPEGEHATLLAIADTYEAAVVNRRAVAGTPSDSDLLKSILRDEQRAIADADLRWIDDLRDRLGA